jgi:hypothetical protein
MLPRFISGHPYFHENINETQAKEIVNASSENEGNFLFCKSDSGNENEFLLVCKGMYKNVLQIRTYRCIYRADLFGSKINGIGTESVFAGLQDIIHYIPTSNLRFREIIPVFMFIPHPIFNPVIQNNKLQYKKIDYAIPPLPNDVTEIIFQYLDMKSLTATARVSKSWYTLFSKNIQTIIQAREQIESAIIKKDQIEREYANMVFLSNRYGNSGLE